jgi:hypothetical protein
LVGVVVTFVGAGEAGANPITIVDQQNLVASDDTGFTTAYGESFRPTLNRVDAVEITARGNASLELSLYDGVGIAGTLLGVSGPVSHTGFNFDTVHFDLLTPVSLTPGNSYTFYVRALTGSSAGLDGDFPLNAYAGGVFINSAGGTVPTIDLAFTEGLTTAASVPEPASFGLVGLGIAALAWRRVRGSGQRRT